MTNYTFVSVIAYSTFGKIESAIVNKNELEDYRQSIQRNYPILVKLNVYPMFDRLATADEIADNSIFTHQSKNTTVWYDGKKHTFVWWAPDFKAAE